jgi:hypothetical protein
MNIEVMKHQSQTKIKWEAGVNGNYRLYATISFDSSASAAHILRADCTNAD